MSIGHSVRQFGENADLWGEEQMELGVSAATRIILVVQCSLNQYVQAFTLHNLGCMTASTLCESKYVVNDEL